MSPDHRVFASPRARKLAAAEHVDLAAVTPTGGGGVRVAEKDVQAYLASAPKASPLAEKIAAEAGIDLRKLTGTGPGGKITKEDVELAVARAGERESGRAGEAPAGAAPVPPLPTSPAQPLPVADVAERIPLKGVRGIIADRMGASVHTTARVTLMLEVDATEFVAARERLKAKVARSGALRPATTTCWRRSSRRACANSPT